MPTHDAPHTPLQVLYQNAVSRVYASTLAGRELASSSFLQLLLANEPPETVSELLEAVAVNGETWCKVVQVKSMNTMIECKVQNAN